MVIFVQCLQLRHKPALNMADNGDEERETQTSIPPTPAEDPNPSVTNTVEDSNTDLNAGAVTDSNAQKEEVPEGEVSQLEPNANLEGKASEPDQAEQPSVPNETTAVETVPDDENKAEDIESLDAAVKPDQVEEATVAYETIDETNAADITQESYEQAEDNVAELSENIDAAVEPGQIEEEAVAYETIDETNTADIMQEDNEQVADNVDEATDGVAVKEQMEQLTVLYENIDDDDNFVETLQDGEEVAGTKKIADEASESKLSAVCEAATDEITAEEAAQEAEKIADDIGAADTSIEQEVEPFALPEQTPEEASVPESAFDVDKEVDTGTAAEPDEVEKPTASEENVEEASSAAAAAAEPSQESEKVTEDDATVAMEARQTPPGADEEQQPPEGEAPPSTPIPDDGIVDEGVPPVEETPQETEVSKESQEKRLSQIDEGQTETDDVSATNFAAKEGEDTGDAAAAAPGSTNRVSQNESEEPVAPAPSTTIEYRKSSAGEDLAEVDKSVPQPPAVPDESNVATAVGENTMNRTEEITHPLNFEWTFGFNRRVPCINLTDESRTIILYVASHVAILYDYKSNQQKLLQGHGNSITCLACSDDKRWLVTGDKGPESCVIVWDSYTGIPVQVLFDLHGDDGVIAVGMSTDAKYVVTVSAGSPQLVSVFDWTSSTETPLYYTELDVTVQLQTYIKFHPSNNQLFVTNSESEVIFYSWANGKLQFDSPPLSDTTFNRTVGTFSQTIFQATLPNRALTATSLGNIVVWDPDRPDKKSGGVVPVHKKRALKLVRVMERSLSALSQTDMMIVSGDTAGHVTFFDDQLNLIFSYRDFKIGSINGITFKYDTEFNAELTEGRVFQDDSTIASKKFVTRDFVVSTKSSEIIHVEVNGTRVTPVFKEHDATVNALAASPAKPWICIGSFAGLLKTWNYETKKVLVTRVFENKAKINTIAFNHNGLQLAVGMANGEVFILDAISFCTEVSFHYARDSITHCAFSCDSKYLATADGQYTTTLFIYSDNSQWLYLGRYKAHYEPIQDIAFGIDPDSNRPRLLTLGRDRVLVEYDLLASSKDDLKLQSVDRIEQSAVPLCLAWYPPVTKESFLLTANDQYKMKLYNTTTKMCRKTMLGPTYGSPVRLITIVPVPSGADPSVNRLLCYATQNKVGLQLLSLDGNPHRSIASIAHPSGVARLTCSHDGKYTFTAGGRDTAVHMWSIHRNVMEAVAALGGEDLVPFYGLLDGGKDGEMYSELEDYFYYAQLRSQGINTTEEREVSRVVPVEQVPFIMRALGFYPSEQEIEDMLNEVKFSQYVETGQYVTELNLAELIKLYVNHRPAFGLSSSELHSAFEVLATSKSDAEPSVNRSELLSVLQRKGEHMTEFELAECFTTLLGYCAEGGSVELGENPDHEAASRDLEEALPESITPAMFADEMLGLNLYV